MNEIIDKVFYSLFQTKNEVGDNEKFAVIGLTIIILMTGVALVFII